MITNSPEKVSPLLRIFSFTDRYAEMFVKNTAIFLVPIAFFIVSLIALTQWDNFYEAQKDKSLSFHVWVQTNGAINIKLSDVASKFAQTLPVENFETKRVEDPIWISFKILDAKPQLNVVEFPSRHATHMSCWDATSLEVLDGIKRVKAGFALTLARPDIHILCRGEYIGPANLKVDLWSADQLVKSENYFHRASGLLDGGMLLLAVFSLVTAWINKRLIYVFFASWLVMNMRLAEMSAGWDLLWIGQVIPTAWVYKIRAVTIALYAVLSVSIFFTLFKNELKETFYEVGLKFVRILALILFFVACFFSYKTFLPIMWSLGSITLAFMIVSLLKVLIYCNTRTTNWYAAALVIVCLSNITEVVAAAFGYREFSGIANNVTAALVCSLLFAIAIAEQMRKEHIQYEMTHAELKNMIKTMPIGLFTLDSDGRCLSANPACFSMVKTSKIQFDEKTWKNHFADDTWFRLHEMLEDQSDAEMEVLSKNGEQRFLLRVSRKDGKIQGVLQDVTEASNATENLRFLAVNDPLTKTFNRRGIDKVFKYSHEILEMGKPMSFAYLDLDRFKLINDLLGYTVGDQVLIQACDRITTLIPSGYFLGRVGGDEFVIVMPDTQIRLAEVIVRSIIESFHKQAFKVGTQTFSVHCSIGLIEVTSNMNLEETLSTADRACREAKMNPSDGLVIYEKDSESFMARRDELLLIEELSSDMATERLFIEMQPILSLMNPFESRNVEALLRLRDSDGKIVSAKRIITAAEISGSTGVIDRWVLTTVLLWIETNLSTLDNMQFCCVNLSGASLNEENFSKEIIQLFNKHPEAAKRICLEITESVALLNIASTNRFIASVRKIGVKISLDNFGTSISSFSYLTGLSADALKIDGNLIANINDHATNICIVESIVNLASNLGMKTIAKWAPDTATVQTLAEIGVDYVQGFAISKSCTLDEVLAVQSFESFIHSKALLDLIVDIGRSHREIRPQVKLIDMERYKEKVKQLRLVNTDETPT